MHYLALPAVLFVALIYPLPVTAQEPTGTAVYAGKVSALSIPAETMGEEWTGPTGLVLDDFENIDKHPIEARPTIEVLKQQFPSIGVVAIADFTYRSKTNPVQQITVRIFVFESESSCSEWWEKRYKFGGWEKQYKEVPNDPHHALDSKEASKRAVAFGNIWMTSGAVGKSEDHVKILDRYVKKIEEAMAKK